MSLGEKVLQEKGVPFTSHPYDYRKKGSEAASQALGIPLGAALKTLVVQIEKDKFIFLVVPGDGTASMKTLSRLLGVKNAELAAEKDAERLTGYKVGGISPLGSQTALPVYMDLKALDHEIVYINGGRRGLLLGIDPEKLMEALGAEIVEVVL